MEVKPGYKQTEVGIIPEDWNEFTVGELIIFEGGSQPNKSHFRLTQKPGYCRLIQIRDYKTDNFEVFVPKILARRFCDENDIMIGRYGPPVFQILRGLAGAYNVALIKAVPSEGLNREFAYYFLTQDTLFQFIDKLSRRTSGQTGVDLKELRSYPFPLPPTIFEQHAIATALSDVDALLDGLDRLIAKKRDLKQAAMQQLITGQTRLPGFSGEWETKPLDNVCSLKSGEGITSENIDDYSPYPCYGGNGLRGFTTTFTHYGEYALIGRQGALCGNVVRVGGKFYASEHALVVTVKPNTDIDWLTVALHRMNLNQYSESSAQPGLSAAKLLFINVDGPPTKSEQAAIAAILSDMDAEITALEARRDKTRALKQGMMQELLTGRIRLVGPSIPKLSEGESDASTATGH